MFILYFEWIGYTLSAMASTRSVVLPSAQAQFPASANRRVQVYHAWHPSLAIGSAPESNGTDGWENVFELATRDVIESLAHRGFTHVSLFAGGTANSRRDVSISALL
jgi:hypothetical protein